MIPALSDGKEDRERRQATMKIREMERTSAAGPWLTVVENGERDRWKEILEDFFEVQEDQMTDTSPLALEGDVFGDHYDIMGWFTLDAGFPGMFPFFSSERSGTRFVRKPVSWDRPYDPYLWEWGTLRYDLPL